MAFRKFLFVCMGNSCNSPMAETIMQNLMVKTSLYWEIDSAALKSWNIGRKPHIRCLRVLREHGLRTDHFCRLLTIGDFSYYDQIVAMNEHVFKELLLWAQVNHVPRTSHVVLLGSYGKDGKPVTITDLSPTRKLKAFRAAYYQIKNCCKQLILSQQVKIVRYDMPSTDDEDERNFASKNKTRAVASSQSIDHPIQYSLHSSQMTSCSLLNCPAKKLCENCGQKFLASSN